MNLNTNSIYFHKLIKNNIVILSYEQLLFGEYIKTGKILNNKLSEREYGTKKYHHIAITVNHDISYQYLSHDIIILLYNL